MRRCGWCGRSFFSTVDEHDAASKDGCAEARAAGHADEPVYQPPARRGNETRQLDLTSRKARRRMPRR